MTGTVTGCDRNEVWDGPKVIARLEKAGATLMAMRDAGYSPRLAQPRYEIVRKLFHDEAPAYRMMLPSPTAEDVDAMDEAFGWVLRIPESRLATRRVVHARALRHPLTDRYVYSWRRIAVTIGSDHKAVMRMHEAGIKIIVGGFTNAPK